MESPREVDGGRVLKHLRLDHRHRRTGKTQHFVNGAPLEGVGQLAIVQYDGDSGYYLVYLSKEGQPLTDTYHESLEAAVDQAEFEYAGSSNSWMDVD